jgi:putative transposase
LEHTLAPVGTPTGNAVAERTIRTLKEECLWLSDFDSLQQLQAALAQWQHDFNHQRPHQALHWQTPAERRAQHLRQRLQEVATCWGVWCW